MLHVCVPDRDAPYHTPEELSSIQYRTYWPEQVSYPSEWKARAINLLNEAKENGALVVATHEYSIVKWIDLLAADKGVEVMWHAWRDGAWHSTPNYYAMESCIDVAFSELFDADIDRAMDRAGK